MGQARRQAGVKLSAGSVLHLARRSIWLALPVADYSQVDILGLRYKSVNFDLETPLRGRAREAERKAGVGRAAGRERGCEPGARFVLMRRGLELHIYIYVHIYIYQEMYYTCIYI